MIRETGRGLVEQIARATSSALSDADYQRQLIASGFEPVVDSSPERLRRLVEDEIARWTPIIKAIGLKLD